MPSRTAACGLDCSACSIYKAANSEAEATKLAEHWRASGYEKAEPAWFKCQGCNGPRELLWCGTDCKIRECCYTQKQHGNCSECAEFTCSRISEFENDGMPTHRAAVESLRNTRKWSMAKAPQVDCGACDCS